MRGGTVNRSKNNQAQDGWEQRRFEAELEESDQNVHVSASTLEHKCIIRRPDSPEPATKISQQPLKQE